IATPGHTIGGCCYYFEQDDILISGDTLFLESVGRTDFPTGSMSTLKRSIQDKLLTLPENVKVYPGHGDSTTIANEKQYNPFCQ
ncbi:MAG TPA: MBL fold metallo-hydrolase, partial [Lachnospiraceae bacterium]|nr:MBL fold metallo-hydrolase [Lachnospiraceae bacterium]